MNAMQKAFETAGLRSEDAAFDKAIALYLNSGGTIERARARLDAAAARMPGMDHDQAARESHPKDVQTRQPVEEGRANVGMSQDHFTAALPSSSVEDVRGQMDSVQQDQKTGASPSSPNRGGRDHLGRAQESPNAPVSPVREPKPQRSPIDFGAAALAVKTKLAESVMDRVKIDGTPIGDYSVRRAQVEGAKKTREGFILREAARIAVNIANPPPGATLRDLVKASEMERIEQAAMRLNDVA